MASSKIMMVMSMIILVFLFGGLMMGFVLQSENVLEQQSGRLIVNNDATMAQLSMHVALRAYNCNGEGGGHFDIVDIGPWTDSWKQWEDWQSYMDVAKNSPDPDGDGHPDVYFGDLRASTPGNITCSGTASTLPFQDKTYLQGAANFVTRSHWGNDQEGRYGRIKFEFNETVWLGKTSGGNKRGCYGLNIMRSGPGDLDGITDMAVFIADEEQYNYFSRNKDNSALGDGNDNGDGYNCVDMVDGEEMVNVENDEGGGGAQDAAILTMNVITPPSVSLDRGPSHTFDVGNDFWSAQAADTIEHTSFRVCKGARGYIQANTGGIDAATNDNRGVWNSGGGVYSIDKPPGKHGEQVGGTASTDNQIRLFMVINNEGNC